MIPRTVASIVVTSNRIYNIKRIGDTGELCSKLELIGASRPRWLLIMRKACRFVRKEAT